MKTSPSETAVASTKRRSRSTPTSRFSGTYADNGKEVRRKAREEAGNRCVRCLHPFETGKHGKGEWSPCDALCKHGGPFRIAGEVHPDATKLALSKLREICQPIEAQWRILTVHHFDGNKANDAWWNQMPLCQRCHLKIQGKVDPRVPYFFEHSPWIKPFCAGFYAMKYEGRDITREEAVARIDALLAYELNGGKRN